MTQIKAKKKSKRKDQMKPLIMIEKEGVSSLSAALSSRLSTDEDRNAGTKPQVF